VELTPDVPLDRQQRVNTAIVMARELKWPTTKILEELGETNPEGAIKDWMMEQLTFAEHAGLMQLIQAETSGALQQAAMQMAQGMMQQQQESMGQAGETGLPEQQPTPGSPPGIPGAEGMGFNPAAGGQPPMAMQPGATFEQMTGETRGGGAP